MTLLGALRVTRGFLSRLNSAKIVPQVMPDVEADRAA